MARGRCRSGSLGNGSRAQTLRRGAKPEEPCSCQELALTLLVAAPLSIAAVQSFAAEKLSAQDETFMREAAQGGLAEVQDAQLAQQKAASAEVKQFAGRMITDHTKANNDLQQIAQSKSMISTPRAEQRGTQRA